MLRLWAMLDTSGNDEHLAGREFDIAIAKLDRESARQHEEEVIGVVVLVPDELPLNPNHRQLVVVEVADDAGTPHALKTTNLLREIDLVVHGHSMPGSSSPVA